VPRNPIVHTEPDHPDFLKEEVFKPKIKKVQGAGETTMFNIKKPQKSIHNKGDCHPDAIGERKEKI